MDDYDRNFEEDEEEEEEEEEEEVCIEEKAVVNKEIKKGRKE